MKKVLVGCVVALVALMFVVAPVLAAQPGSTTNDQVRRGLFNTFLGWTSVFTKAAETQNGVDLLLLIPRGAAQAVAYTAYGPVDVLTSAIPENAFLQDTSRSGEPEAQAARGAANTVLGWTEPFAELARSEGGIDTALKLIRAPFKAVIRTFYGVMEIVTVPVPESNYLRPAGPVQ